MKNLRGILVAAIFLGLTALLKRLAVKYGLLMHVAYPFFSKTVQEILGSVTSGTAMCVWQVLLAVAIAAAVVSFALMILFRWNFFRWLGCILAPVSVCVFLFTALWGLNYYNEPITTGMKLPVPDYTVEELKNATRFYRQKADELSAQVPRDADGNVALGQWDQMNQTLSQAYDNLVMDYSIFSGSRGPVKQLGWSDLFSRMGTTGVTVGLTGEAAVNMNAYSAMIPFLMCHETAHLLAIANEKEANFAAFLACQASEDPLFQYSGYLNAYLYCSNALYVADSDAWTDIRAAASEQVRYDLKANQEVAEQYKGKLNDQAQTAYDEYQKSFGQEDGILTYGKVADYLVAWHLDQYVVSEAPPPTEFDPLNYDDVFGAAATEDGE